MQSPLAALNIMIDTCDELEAGKRSFLNTITSKINHITQSALSEYKGGSTKQVPLEKHQVVVCSTFLTQLIAEKKYEYIGYPNILVEQISPEAQSVCIKVQPIQLGRALSNLINNAIDALNDKVQGKVMIKLDADDVNVKIIIQDNGRGMPDTLVQKIEQRISFTSGKAQGHGLGMMQVWDMLDANNGKFIIQSKLGVGTSVELLFAKVPADSLQS
jgi:signal transduction histidine kinase